MYLGATKIFITESCLFQILRQEWSEGVYGMDSTTTRYTILGISEEKNKIEEEEEDPAYTYLKK